MKITVTKLLHDALRMRWRIKGRAGVARATPLILDQTEARRAERNFFGDRPPVIPGSRWPGPPLSESLDTPLECTVTTVHCEQTSQSVIKCLWYGWDWIFDHGKILLIKHLVYHFSGHYLYFPDVLRIQDVFCQTGNHFFVLAISWMTLLEWKVWSFS